MLGGVSLVWRDHSAAAKQAEERFALRYHIQPSFDGILDPSDLGHPSPRHSLLECDLDNHTLQKFNVRGLGEHVQALLGCGARRTQTLCPFSQPEQPTKNKSVA
jgi:hypothetical protein